MKHIAVIIFALVLLVCGCKHTQHPVGDFLPTVVTNTSPTIDIPLAWCYAKYPLDQQMEYNLYWWISLNELHKVPIPVTNYWVLSIPKAACTNKAHIWVTDVDLDGDESLPSNAINWPPDVIQNFVVNFDGQPYQTFFSLTNGITPTPMQFFRAVVDGNNFTIWSITNLAGATNLSAWNTLHSEVLYQTPTNVTLSINQQLQY